MFYKIFDEYGTETESEIIFVSPNIVYAIGTNSCYEEEDNFWLCYTINETVDFNSINNILLGKFNKNDHSFQSWILGDTGVSEYYKTIFKNQDGNLVLVGTSTWYYGGDSIVNKLGVNIIDTLGNILDQRYYMMDNNICVGFYGEQLSNGDYILSGWVDGPNPDDLDMYYLRTDSEGTKLWEKRIGHPTENDGACRVYSINEDTFLLKGIYFDHLYLAYLNNNGDILYEKYGGEFSFAERTSIYTDLFFRNNSIFGVLHVIPQNGNVERHLINMDKNFNILNLTNISGEIGEDNYLNDLKLTEDCGFITCGYVVYEDNTAQARIIKLSSDGDTCFPPDCEGYEEPEECIDTAVEYISASSVFSIYPNPANGFIRIQWIDNFHNTSFTKLEIMSIEGKIIDQFDINSSATVDVSHLEAGIYLLSVYDSIGNTHSAKLCIK
jgi:hypothetical protein